MIEEFRQHSDAIEECYEFMLAYAAQGLPGDAGNQSGGQLREFLRRAIYCRKAGVRDCPSALLRRGSNAR